MCSLIFPGGFWRDSQRVPGVSRTLRNSWSFFKGGEASGQMGWTAWEMGSRTGLTRTGWLSRQRPWAEFSLVEDFKVSATPTPGCPYFESVHLQGASVGPACPPTSATITTFRSKPPLFIQCLRNKQGESPFHVIHTFRRVMCKSHQDWELA